jgi:hypothetical protein
MYVVNSKATYKRGRYDHTLINTSLLNQSRHFYNPYIFKTHEITRQCLTSKIVSAYHDDVVFGLSRNPAELLESLHLAAQLRHCI